MGFDFVCDLRLYCPTNDWPRHDRRAKPRAASYPVSSFLVLLAFQRRSWAARAMIEFQGAGRTKAGGGACLSVGADIALGADGDSLVQTAGTYTL